ncbi:Fic family protein [Gloeothece citriformis]
MATAYGYGFLKNHCFVDGNKRVALISVYTFLYQFSITLNLIDPPNPPF